MSVTIRQTIITAFDTRMKTIKVAAGYVTDLGNKVYEWLQAPFQDDEAISLIYRDRNTPIERTVGCDINTLAMEVVVVIPSAATMEEVRKAVADVIKCVGVDVTWSGLAQDTSPITEDTVEFEHQNRKIAGILLTFNIMYTTAPFDPYTAV